MKITIEDAVIKSIETVANDGPAMFYSGIYALDDNVRKPNSCTCMVRLGNGVIYRGILDEGSAILYNTHTDEYSAIVNMLTTDGPIHIKGRLDLDS